MAGKEWFGDKEGGQGHGWGMIVPQLEKLRSELGTIQTELEKRPETAEKYLPQLEKVKGVLEKASSTGQMGSTVKPLLGHINQLIRAIQGMDWQVAIREVKETNKIINGIIQKSHAL